MTWFGKSNTAKNLKLNQAIEKRDIVKVMKQNNLQAIEHKFIEIKMLIESLPKTDFKNFTFNEIKYIIKEIEKIIFEIKNLFKSPIEISKKQKFESIIDFLESAIATSKLEINEHNIEISMRLFFEVENQLRKFN